MHPGRARRAGVPYGRRAQALRAPQCLALGQLDCMHDTLGLYSARHAVLEGLEASGALQQPFLDPFLCQVLEGIMVLCLPAEAAVWSLRLQLASCSVMTMHEACNDATSFVLSGRGIPASSLDGSMACSCAPFIQAWLCTMAMFLSDASVLGSSASVGSRCSVGSLLHDRGHWHFFHLGKVPIQSQELAFLPAATS